MIWNNHSTSHRHAFLSPSSYHWLKYDAEKLITKYANHKAAAMGTKIHSFAETCIQMNQRLPMNSKTLNMFVNDSIGYRMDPEVMLFYSDNCFGTADAVSFSSGRLRIFDLKTGVTPASPNQILVYAALFCLEYGERPSELELDLRIYQLDEVFKLKIPHEDITKAMAVIIAHNKLLMSLQEDA